MIRIRLSEQDRVKYTLPEWISYDSADRRVGEVREVRRQCGMKWWDLMEGLRSGDPECLGVLAWLAARRAGVTVEWESFEIDWLFDLETVKDPNAPAPNPPAPDGASS